MGFKIALTAQSRRLLLNSIEEAVEELFKKIIDNEGSRLIYNGGHRKWRNQ